MAQALREAYGDIFLIKENPTASDKSAIEGKFKSFHNASDNVAGLMAKTFFGLLNLADLSNKAADKAPSRESEITMPPNVDSKAVKREAVGLSMAGLHYNIQIHLPATKDIEVYNAIFKALREHLLEK